MKTGHACSCWDRMPSLAVNPRWTDEANAFGVRGITHAPEPVYEVMFPSSSDGSVGPPRGLRVSRVSGVGYARGPGDAAETSAPGRELTVIAHRGASSYAPENTMAAFTLACAMGARDIELDVHQARDGGIVVIHDAAVDRTTDGTGAVAEMTVAELQALDAGTWFSPAFAGEPIPALDTVLEEFAGRLRFHIELKGRNEELAGRVAERVRAQGRGGDVIFTSFRPEALEAAADAAPAIPRGWLVRGMGEDLLARAAALGLRQICPAASDVTPEAVQRWHREGYQVRAWGVKDEALMERAIRAGVDGMTVNFPDRLLARVRPDPFGPTARPC